MNSINEGFDKESSEGRFKELEALRKEGCSWIKIWNKTYIDEPLEAEAFVRLVEKESQVVITSAKQLQNLTELKESANFREIEETFLQAMEFRYHTALYKLIKGGAKYKELLTLEPEHFHLPENWGTYSGEGNKDIVIKKAIYRELADLVSVRAYSQTVAEMLEAPYSLVLEASKIFDKKN